MPNKLDIEYIKKEYNKIRNLFLAGQYQEVIDKTKVLIKKDPYQATFYNYIALSYNNLRKLKFAKEFLLRGLDYNPKNQSLLVNLSTIYRTEQNFIDAEKILREILDTNPNHFTALSNLANLKRDLNKDEEATKLYEQAYKLDNTNITLLANLAISYQTLGEFDKCKEILKQIEFLDPKKTIQDKIYSSFHKYSKDDEHQRLMIKKSLDKSIPQNEKINLYFSIAKSFSDHGDHKKSGEFFIMGNDTKRKTLLNYHTKDEEKLYSIIFEKFKNYNFSNNDILKKPELIFIVGLPRSGTTLLHQIISSHSEIFGAGELPILRTNFIENTFDDNWFKRILIDGEIRKKLSYDIMSQFKLHNDKMIILDKAPLNFQWVGFIKLLFPNAKIIHSKRNLKDTALSIYKNVFEDINMPWSYNQEELITFIGIYKNFMQFWHKKLPNFIYDCNYENLINDQVNETKKLISFCGLKWDEKCIDYTKNNTGIKTISLSQARKPIYKDSINLSSLYKDSLKFLDNISD
tara:strand:- start:738 stop:2291 length:1554 start_codon:yes stop_codon:yes gene_type:complete